MNEFAQTDGRSLTLIKMPSHSQKSNFEIYDPEHPSIHHPFFEGEHSNLTKTG